MYAFPLRAGYKAQASPFSLVEADETSLREVRSQHPKQLSQHKLNILLERLRAPGETCWLIVDDSDRCCGYAHVALRTTVNTRINHTVRLGPRQAYFFDDYVFKRHRNRGLHSFSIARRAEIVADLGVTEVVTTITKGNGASLATYSKFGARRIATLLYFAPLKRTVTIPALGIARPQTPGDPSRVTR